MARETGKRRAQGIPLDYYKKPDALVRGRVILSAVAFIAAVGWFASGLDFSRGSVGSSPAGKLRYSKGPLASVHQTWDAKCEACHESFASIDSSRWSPPGFVARDSSTADHLCMSCHKGPPHNELEIKDQVKSCAGCHIDHRGRDVSLVRISDLECTTCHGDLKDHRKPAGAHPPIVKAESIHAFATDHPPFPNDVAGFKDPGRLKFNHSLHLNAGQVKKPGDRGGKTLADLAPADRERYRMPGQKDGDLVSLDCASCHVTDAADLKLSANADLSGLPRALALPPRAPGEEMLPINYETQCKACHALTFDERLPKLVAPHRLQPAEIRRFLVSTYAGVQLDENPELLKPFSQSKPPIVGRPAPRDEETIKSRIEAAADAAERVLYQGKTTCMECHYTQGEQVDVRPAAIEVPKVPTYWYEHAHFDHTAHRAMGCNNCHQQARGSEKATDVLLPTMISCRECHAPAASVTIFTSATAELKGGVRHDCTTCHRYHDRDHPDQGRGAISERGSVDRDAKEFLSGTGGKPVVPTAPAKN